MARIPLLRHHPQVITLLCHNHFLGGVYLHIFLDFSLDLLVNPHDLLIAKWRTLNRWVALKQAGLPSFDVRSSIATRRRWTQIWRPWILQTWLLNLELALSGWVLVKIPEMLLQCKVVIELVPIVVARSHEQSVQKRDQTLLAVHQFIDFIVAIFDKTAIVILLRFFSHHREVTDCWAWLLAWAACLFWAARLATAISVRRHTAYIRDPLLLFQKL